MVPSFPELGPAVHRGVTLLFGHAAPTPGAGVEERLAIAIRLDRSETLPDTPRRRGETGSLGTGGGREGSGRMGGFGGGTNGSGRTGRHRRLAGGLVRGNG